MRTAQELRERAAEEERARDADSRRRSAERRRRTIEAQIAALQGELEDEADAERRVVASERTRLARRDEDRSEMARSRQADAPKPANGRGGARAGARN